MPTIYRKTDKGRAEIETRAHRLVPRLRQALILVDGNRRDDELAKLIPNDPIEVLGSLLAGGFIELVRVVEAGRPTPTAVASVAPRQPAPAAPESAAGVPLPVRRRELVRALMDAVGPVGEPLAMRIEKVTDEVALRSLAETAQQVILANRGASAAEAFAQRFLRTPG